MEPGGSMLHSQWLFKVDSNNFLSSHLPLGLPKGLFLVGLAVIILKGLLSYSILVTWPAKFNFLDSITLTVLGERYKLKKKE